MHKALSPRTFLAFFVAATALILIGATLLPHDRYHRFQTHHNVTTRKADWIYERLHFDKTPIDVAIIGTSRSAGGLSGPHIERAYCLATGRRIHVANLAIPVTGRNMHYVVAKELARTKTVQLAVLELNEIESRRPHKGFIFLADSIDVVTAPVAINLNFASDLLRLPGRQIELFLKGLFAKPDLRMRFDPDSYAGPHMDLTQVMYSIDGKMKSRDVVHAKTEMEFMRKIRAAGASPTYLMPPLLRPLEYRFPRRYVDKARRAIQKAGGALAFSYIPAYGAADYPDILRDELALRETILELGADIPADHSLWLDATHLNATGARLASERFSQALAEKYPTLGESACN